MNYLLSFLEALSGSGGTHNGLSATPMASEVSLAGVRTPMTVYYCLTAAAIFSILLAATQHITSLRNAASHKIQEIDRSV